jgi:hypothetical protein
LPITAGVHPDRAADTAGHTGKEFQAGKPGVSRNFGGGIGACPGAKLRYPFLLLLARFPCPAARIKDYSANTGIGGKYIRPAAQYKNRYVCGAGNGNERGGKCRKTVATGPQPAIRRAAGPERAEFRHGPEVTDLKLAGVFPGAGFDNLLNLVNIIHNILMLPRYSISRYGLKSISISASSS